MTKFRVPVKIEFDGAVLVEAEDESEAEEIACGNITAFLGQVFDNNSDKVLDNVFDMRGYAYLRDDESIEEAEDL